MPKGGISIEYSKMVGDLASDLRRRRGLTQEAAAQLSGVSQQGISKLEQGEKRILPSTALQVLYSLATPESGLSDQVDALVAAVPQLVQEMKFRELVDRVGSAALATAPYIFSEMIAEELGMNPPTVYQRLRSRGIIPS